MLLAASGRHLERQTLNRKCSAVINYFVWLRSLETITDDPSSGLTNARVQCCCRRLSQHNTQATRDKLHRSLRHTPLGARNNWKVLVT